MKRLAILGASGHGKVVADIAESLGWQEVLFFDDAWPALEQNSAWPVVGNTERLLSSLPQFEGVFVAIGNNAVRLKKLVELIDKGARLVSLIHPSAMVSRYAQVGIGSVIMPQAVVNIDTVLGLGCIINSGATVDHDCELGNAVHISPGVNLAGGVQVGESAWVGIGACVRQLISIGAGSVVGAGAVVVSPVAEQLTVMGNPAGIKNNKGLTV